MSGILELERKEGREEGRREGHREGREESISIFISSLRKYGIRSRDMDRINRKI